MTDVEYKWNMAEATNKRIDTVIIDSHKCRLRNDFIGWYKCLEILRTEVWPYLSKNDKKIKIELTGLYDKVHKQYKLYVNSKNMAVGAFKVPISNQFHLSLSEFQDILMWVLDKKGLLHRKESKPTDEIW